MLVERREVPIGRAIAGIDVNARLLHEMLEAAPVSRPSRTPSRHSICASTEVKLQLVRARRQRSTVSYRTCSGAAWKSPRSQISTSGPSAGLLSTAVHALTVTALC